MQVTNPPSITSQELLLLAQQAQGQIHHLYLHWTAGRYHQYFDDYHLNVDEDGQVYRTCDSLTQRKAHTYKRNSGSVGIALCCALDASWNATLPNFGDGYGPGSDDPETRWDLFWVRDELGQFHQGGVFLRELARQFSTRLVPTKRNSAPQNAPTQEAPLQVPLFME